MTAAVEPIPIKAHSWQREAQEHYVEPHWCSERLFQEEKFAGPIWDPCCGFGRIPDSAAACGLASEGTDIVDRGWRRFSGRLDFLSATRISGLGDFDVVCNPPFNIAGRFARHALDLEGSRKVAMIFPTARLNAAHWLKGTPLLRVWLMTPRPSMPPGHVITAGERPQGGKMDFCWLVWTKGYAGAPVIGWLRRDA